MKLEKNVIKKRKLLNKDVSKASKELIKPKLKTQNVEHKKKEKSSLTENSKKVKTIKRLKDAEVDTTVAVSKEKKKISKKDGKNGKKKIVGITDKKDKEDMQVSSKTSEEEKQENVKNKNYIQKANLKRKSLSSRKESKKFKSDPDTSKKQQKPTDIKSISKKKVESEEKEDDSSLKDLSKKHVLQCISAIFHLTQEQLKNQNNLFSGEAQPIFMQVTCIRVPKVPRRQVRMTLPHSIVLPQDDIALFVCDLAKGKRKDYEPTVDHYREILDKCGCTQIKDIIPMNQVKTEYDQYELKRKLVASYDHFLVDGRIAGHMLHLLGKIFYKKRKFPTSIRMDSKTLAIIIIIGLAAAAGIGYLIYWLCKRKKNGGKSEPASTDDFFSGCEKNIKDAVKTKWGKIDNDDKFKMFVAGMRTVVSVGKENYFKIGGITEDKQRKAFEEKIDKVKKSINELAKITKKDDVTKKLGEIKHLDIIAKLITGETGIDEKKYDTDENLKAAIKEVVDANSSKKDFFEKKISEEKDKEYTVVQAVVNELAVIFKEEITEAKKAN